MARGPCCASAHVRSAQCCGTHVTHWSQAPVAPAGPQPIAATPAGMRPPTANAAAPRARPGAPGLAGATRAGPAVPRVKPPGIRGILGRIRVVHLREGGDGLGPPQKSLKRSPQNAQHIELVMNGSRFMAQGIFALRRVRPEGGVLHPNGCIGPAAQGASGGHGAALCGSCADEDVWAGIVVCHCCSVLAVWYVVC